LLQAYIFEVQENVYLCDKTGMESPKASAL